MREVTHCDERMGINYKTKEVGSYRKVMLLYKMIFFVKILIQSRRCETMIGGSHEHRRIRQSG